MTRTGPNQPDPDEAERMAATRDQAATGWTQTLEDMRAMAADREESGYETLTVQTGNTAPKGPEQGEDDRWGLFYVVPGNVADDLEATLDRATFEETAVYQASIGRDTFLVTEVIDHDAELILFVAGAYRRGAAGPLVETALERERMHSHLRRLDGTPIGSIEHDDPDAFFPDPDAILQDTW
jgi:hypothetical protein